MTPGLLVGTDGEKRNMFKKYVQEIIEAQGLAGSLEQLEPLFTALGGQIYLVLATP